MQATAVVLVGARNRILDPGRLSGASTVSSAWCLANQSAASAMLSAAQRVIFTGYFRSDTGEIEVERSLALAELVGSACRSERSKVLMLSTDAVFSGRRGSYARTDAPDPSSPYGSMKLGQEQAMSGAAILRFTVFGPSFSARPTLFETVRQAQMLKLFPNAYFSPVSSFAVNDVLCRHLRAPLDPGIHHLSAGRVSKSHLVERLLGSVNGGHGASFETDDSINTDFSLLPSSASLTLDLDAELSRMLR
jgi:hypothetical protein